MQYLSPSCQQVVSNNLDDHESPQGRLIVRSCLDDPYLKPIVLDHKCNNCILTPSGLYSDMALTIATYIFQTYNKDPPSTPGITITDLQVHKPLIVKNSQNLSQLWIEIEASFNKQNILLPTNAAHALITLTFHSITLTGHRLQPQGHCTITFSPPNLLLTPYIDLTPSLLSRISHLHTRAQKETFSPTVHLFCREKAYNLFSTFVQYSPTYQNMSEVIYNTETLEATSTITFPSLSPTGQLNRPYFLDATCHISGFLANVVADSTKKFVYINAGVGSMRFSENFQPEKLLLQGHESGGQESVLKNYVQMRKVGKDETILEGDVFVLQDGEVVGVWEKVRFKRIPRRVVDVFLPPLRDD